MTSALARVSKEWLQICTLKCCISCTNIFFTVKAKVLFNPDQAAQQNMRVLAAALVTIHWKRNPSGRQQLDKRKPSFLQSPPNQLLPLSHTNNHYSSQTRPGPKPQSQHSRGFLHARNPAAMAVRAPSSAWTRATSVAVCCTNTPLPCRDLAALAPGNSDGLFPLFSHLHQEEKRMMLWTN